MDYDISNEWQAEAGLSIHSGFPNPAADKWLPTLDFNQLLIRHPSSTFVFRIREGSGKGIHAGDLAIIDRAEVYRPRDFVVWHDGQEFKLTRAQEVDSGGVRVWGVVTATIHELRNKES